jgi:hypothetical protein
VRARSERPRGRSLRPGGSQTLELIVCNRLVHELTNNANYADGTGTSGVHAKHAPKRYADTIDCPNFAPCWDSRTLERLGNAGRTHATRGCPCNANGTVGRLIRYVPTVGAPATASSPSSQRLLEPGAALPIRIEERLAITACPRSAGQQR